MRTLTLRELNRATLARQMLLSREPISAVAAVERLVGMHAQLPAHPYSGLWSRIEGFEREELVTEVERRTIVKATMMRGTLHLVSSDHFCRFRTTLQPGLSAGWAAITRGRAAGFDMPDLIQWARDFLAGRPRSFAEISSALPERFPRGDVGVMRYAIRLHVPLIQAPNPGGLSYPSKPAFALAEEWLCRKPDVHDRRRELLERFLAAFGPATVRDAETWSGIPGLKQAFEEMAGELMTYRGETGSVLYDLPGAPLPDPETPAPVRFLPEFDNLLLSHAVRRRVISDDYRKRVYLPALRVAATFLVDGFVRGIWRVEQSKETAAIMLELFEPFSAAQRSEIELEANALVRFLCPEAGSHAVRFG